VAERSSDPSISQALHVINGDTLNKKLSAPNGFVSLFLKLGLSEGRMLDHVFLSTYGRYPTEDEKRAITESLRKSRLAEGTIEAKLEGRRQSVEDMLWAMLTSKEFLFNH
jgi:hypothetical protein